MKLDIVNAFGTGFIQADERHEKVKAFHESVGEKSVFPITIQPLDSEEYLGHILAFLRENKGRINNIIQLPTVEQVTHLREYYHKENQGLPVAFTGIHETIDKKVDDMVDVLVETYAKNILVNQASDPISLVRKIKTKFFLVVTGNFCAEDGHGAFTLKEFLIENIKSATIEESMGLSIDTLDLKLQRMIKGDGIGKYEALVRAYEAGNIPVQ